MRGCFVAGCKTGNRKDTAWRRQAGIRIPSLFSAPKDPALFEFWQRVIPRADRKLGPKDIVCELHFKDEDIDCASELKLFDGTIYRHEKLRRRLKPGAIPSIFSNTPGHSSYCPPQEKPTKKRKKSKKKNGTKKSKKRKVSAINTVETAVPSSLMQYTLNQDNVPETEIPERNLTEVPITEENLTLNTDSSSTKTLNIAPSSTNTLNTASSSAKQSKDTSVIKQPNEFLQMVIDILTKEPELIKASPITEEEFLESTTEHLSFESDHLETIGEQFSFNFVKMNLHVIKRANSWWAINAIENFIICARWNSHCVVERKIVISEDLNYKVFLKEKEIKMWADRIELTSLRNIARVIEQVENINICEGIHNKDSNCYGFIQSGLVSCRRKNLCINCIKVRAQSQKEEKQRLREMARSAPKHVELLRIHFRY